MACLDGATGALLWTWTGHGQGSFGGTISAPLAYEAYYIFAAASGAARAVVLHAVFASNGTDAWASPAVPGSGVFPAGTHNLAAVPVLVTQGMFSLLLVLDGSGGVNAFDRHGARLWNADLFDSLDPKLTGIVLVPPKFDVSGGGAATVLHVYVAASLRSSAPTPGGTYVVRLTITNPFSAGAAVPSRAALVALSTGHPETRAVAGVYVSAPQVLVVATGERACVFARAAVAAAEAGRSRYAMTRACCVCVCGARCPPLTCTLCVVCLHDAVAQAVPRSRPFRSRLATLLALKS